MGVGWLLWWVLCVWLTSFELKRSLNYGDATLFLHLYTKVHLWKSYLICRDSQPSCLKMSLQCVPEVQCQKAAWLLWTGDSVMSLYWSQRQCNIIPHQHNQRGWTMALCKRLRVSVRTTLHKDLHIPILVDIFLTMLSMWWSHFRMRNLRFSSINIPRYFDTDTWFTGSLFMWMWISLHFLSGWYVQSYLDT